MCGLLSYDQTTASGADTDNIEDIDESIDDDAVSSVCSSSHRKGKSRSRGASAYSNDFGDDDDDDDDDDERSNSRGATDKDDIGQDEIDAVSDVSIGYSDEM